MLLKGANMKELLAVVLSEDENGMVNLAFQLDNQTQLTARIDQLIKVLAQKREAMEPAFPDRLPLVSHIEGINHPAWQWSVMGDGSMVLNIRHPGLGWLSFRMPNVDQFQENLLNLLDQRNALVAQSGKPQD